MTSNFFLNNGISWQASNVGGRRRYKPKESAHSANHIACFIEAFNALGNQVNPGDDVKK